MSKASEELARVEKAMREALAKNPPNSVEAAQEIARRLAEQNRR